VRSFVKLALAAAIAMQMMPAAAATWQPSLAGVWQGTLGGQPIRACFDQLSWGPFGAYYYLSHLRAIALQPAEEQTRKFVEGFDERDATSPRWNIESVTPQQIAGQWVHAGRSFELRLTRVPTAERDTEGASCGSMAFNAARLQGVRTVRKAARKDGVGYTRLILDHRGHFDESVSVETFSLAGDTPAVRRINAELGKPLRADDWLECVRSGLDANGQDGDNSETLEPRMITRRWLSVMNESGWYCGGAHPDDAAFARLFDRETGREVDLHQWLNGNAVTKADDLIGLRPALRNVVLGQHKTDSECLDTVNDQAYWNMELTRSGMVFMPILPHVAVGCRDEYPVPFAKLQPFLTPEGKRQIAALEAEVASRR